MSPDQTHLLHTKQRHSAHTNTHTPVSSTKTLENALQSILEPQRQPDHSNTKPIHTTIITLQSKTKSKSSPPPPSNPPHTLLRTQTHRQRQTHNLSDVRCPAFQPEGRASSLIDYVSFRLSSTTPALTAVWSCLFVLESRCDLIKAACLEGKQSHRSEDKQTR
jgi:hypothetical protein